MTYKERLVLNLWTKLDKNIIDKYPFLPELSIKVLESIHKMYKIPLPPKSLKYLLLYNADHVIIKKV